MIVNDEKLSHICFFPGVANQISDDEEEEDEDRISIVKGLIILFLFLFYLNVSSNEATARVTNLPEQTQEQDL